MPDKFSFGSLKFLDGIKCETSLVESSSRGDGYINNFGNRDQTEHSYLYALPFSWHISSNCNALNVPLPFPESKKYSYRNDFSQLWLQSSSVEFRVSSQTNCCYVWHTANGTRYVFLLILIIVKLRRQTYVGPC